MTDGRRKIDGFSHEVVREESRGPKPECEHTEFDVNAKMLRLANDHEPGKIDGFMLEIATNCTQCGLRFKFKGLPGGISLSQPRCDVLGYEASMPMEPGEPVTNRPSGA